MKFENSHEVEAFVNFLEKFINAVGTGKLNPAHLNKTRDDLENFIKESSQLREKPIDDTKTWLCPDCGKEMVLRMNRSNGEKFWGCPKYPECKGTRDIAGLTREERAAEKAKAVEVQQQSGFRFRKT